MRRPDDILESHPGFSGSSKSSNPFRTSTGSPGRFAAVSRKRSRRSNSPMPQDHILSPPILSGMSSHSTHVDAVEREASYLLEVLLLEDGITEQQLDDQIIAQANKLGVDNYALRYFQGRRQSLPSLFAIGRPTLASWTTPYANGPVSGPVSKPSNDVSRANPSHGRSRSSLSFRDYDTFLSHGVPTGGRNSLSFVPPINSATSVFSLPLASPESSYQKKHVRRLKRLIILRRTKVDSNPPRTDSCPHCPQSTWHRRGPTHYLPCGHRLCLAALQETVSKATSGGLHAIPSCCGIPIPGELVELVLTQDERDAALEKLQQWDDAASVLSTTHIPRQDSATADPPTPPFRGERKSPAGSKVDSFSPRTPTDYAWLHDQPDFDAMQTDQARLSTRFKVWAEAQRSLLESRHILLRAEMDETHDRSATELVGRHAAELAALEDRQVAAEAELRTAQAKEERDTATALKHMEAYCAGLFTSGDRHRRVVVDKDVAELQKARRVRDGMAAKHASAINVLRGEQGLRAEARAQAQETESRELRAEQEKERSGLERESAAEMRLLDGDVVQKRARIELRWELRCAVFAEGRWR